MSDERITIWERIRFKNSEAISWERSLDKGKTWEPVHWLFKTQLPFILMNRDDDITEIVAVKWEAQ
jgi:hypothetical protein